MPSLQAEQFRTFGFAVWRQLLSADEVAAIDAELVGAMDEAYANTPFDGSRRHWLPLLSPRTPRIAALAEDPRFLDAARELLDGEVVLLIADGNRYCAPTAWHPDSDGIHGIKFFLYHSALTAGDSALRVIPGSHVEPFAGEVGRFMSNCFPTEDAPCYVFESQPGDVLAFDFPMWHASVGPERERRMCTIEYYRIPDDADQAQRICNHVAAGAPNLARAFPHRGFPFYDPAWLADLDATPLRRKLVGDMESVGLIAATGGY